MKDLSQLQRGARCANLKSRERALDNYYKNPKVCLNCGKIIPIPEDKKVSEIRRKKFCDQSCGAEFNNRNRIKNPRVEQCLECGVDLPRIRNTGGRYSRRSYCDSCRTSIRVVKQGKVPKKDFEKKEGGRHRKELGTKEHLKSKSACWIQWRSTICRHAREVYKESDKPYICNHCGYSLHVDVCHIKGVSEFSGDALIEEINRIDNLVTLCKNHHWEFDHGFLKL